MAQFIDWSKLYSSRNIVKKRFPSIWDLSLIKKEISLLDKYLRPGANELVIGAGDRRMSGLIASKFSDIGVLIHSSNLSGLYTFDKPRNRQLLGKLSHLSLYMEFCWLNTYLQLK